MMKNTINCFISGRVQGVCYRMSAGQQAKNMGITGWVKNLDDGRVEVMATGEKQALDDFRRWLSQGPDRAEVVTVECTHVADQEFADFTIR